MTDEKIARINELAKKKKSSGLTDAELEEQKRLRQEFLADFKKSFISELSNIDVVKEDGTVENLGESYARKHAE